MRVFWTAVILLILVTAAVFLWPTATDPRPATTLDTNAPAAPEPPPPALSGHSGPASPESMGIASPHDDPQREPQQADPAPRPDPTNEPNPPTNMPRPAPAPENAGPGDPIAKSTPAPQQPDDTPPSPPDVAKPEPTPAAPETEAQLALAPEPTASATPAVEPDPVPAPPAAAEAEPSEPPAAVADAEPRPEIAETLQSSTPAPDPAEKPAPPAVQQTPDGLLLNDRWTAKGRGTAESPFVINWDLLVAVKRAYQPRLGQDKLPEWITALDGKQVSIEGYALLPIDADTMTELLVMRNQWDGCCIGVPPTPYDAIEVTLASPLGDRARQLFALNGSNAFGRITGTFKVDPYINGNWLLGLYLLNAASADLYGPAGSP